MMVNEQEFNGNDYIVGGAVALLAILYFVFGNDIL